MDKYKFMVDFEIDEDQLENLSPQECFALGSEFGTFIEDMKTNKTFSMTVHNLNVSRMSNTLDSFLRKYKVEELADGWSELSVEECRDE